MQGKISSDQIQQHFLDKGVSNFLGNFPNDKKISVMTKRWFFGSKENTRTLLIRVVRVNLKLEKTCRDWESTCHVWWTNSWSKSLKFSCHNGIVTWHDGTLKAKNKNVFFSVDLFQILSDTFTINIDLASR